MVKQRIRATMPSAREQRHDWTPANFRARSLELMETHSAGWWSCRGTAHGLTAAGELAWIEVAVPSATVTGLLYDARYDAERDVARCSCVAALRHQPCWHAGVAWAYGQRATEIQRSFLLAGANYWTRVEENERAIWPSL